jgi:hypothetical protein
MRVIGYSERGAINALFYEIAYSNRPTELLKEFLALAKFSTTESIGASLTDARVLMEQSLSDFGDGDAVVPRQNLVHLENVDVLVSRWQPDQLSRRCRRVLCCVPE